MVLQNLRLNFARIFCIPLTVTVFSLPLSPFLLPPPSRRLRITDGPVNAVSVSASSGGEEGRACDGNVRRRENRQLLLAPWRFPHRSRSALVPPRGECVHRFHYVRCESYFSYPLSLSPPFFFLLTFEFYLFLWKYYPHEHVSIAHRKKDCGSVNLLKSLGYNLQWQKNALLA